LNILIKDIYELDPISTFPLAIGWYIVAIIILLSLLLIFRLSAFWREYPRGSWNKEAYYQLKDLKLQAKNKGGVATAKQFSELLRRIAMARCGREQCAGLAGDNWLKWLESQDPKGFLWTQKGKLLLTLPYAPEKSVSHIALIPLIEASLYWTSKKYRCLL